MKKRIIALLLVGAFIISGCALATRFQEAKDAYLNQRVDELLADDQAVEPVVEKEVTEVATEMPEVVETLETEPEDNLVPEEELEVEQTSEAEGEDLDTDEEAEADETPEADEEGTDADATPEIESDDPGVYLGDPDWLDDMEPGEYYWNLATDQYMSAAYDDGTLRLQALSEVMGWRIASTPVLGDAYIETSVKMGACSNTDGYGLVFRVPEQVAYNQGYFFGITCDGKYSLRVWDGLSGTNGKTTWLRYPKGDENILKGKDAVNKLGVMLIDDSITLYINGEMVEQFIDATFMEGFFGLYINRDYTENLTINVDQVSYWTDPLE